MTFRPNVLRVVPEVADPYWIVAAPGEVITERPEYRYRYPLRGAGLGFLAGLAMSSLGWVHYLIMLLMIPAGAALGFAWQKWIALRFSRLGRQLRAGTAVRLEDDRTNARIVARATAAGPMYWDLAQRGVERDRLLARLRDRQIARAERTVLQQDVSDLERTIGIGLAKAATGDALRALAASSDGDAAAGMVAGELYLTQQRGRSAVLDANT